jgi:hypothetical protein
MGSYEGTGMMIRKPPRGSVRAWGFIVAFLVAGALIVTGLLLARAAPRPLGIALFFTGCAGCFASGLGYYYTPPAASGYGRPIKRRPGGRGR